MNDPIKTAIAWLKNEAVVTPDNRMYASEIADQAAQDLARITAERDAYKKICDDKTPEEMDAFINLLIEKQAEISKNMDVLLKRIDALKQSS